MSNEVGSMDVVMNYKDGGLQDGLKDTKKGLDNAKDSGKSVKQEMMRLNAVSVATGQVIADVGKKLLDMFVGALTSSPYLIGSFTRIKVAIQMLFWQLSKYLKPALDLVADAVVALTKGDWGFFKEKAVEAFRMFADAAVWAWEKIVDAGTKAWYWIKAKFEDVPWVQTVMTKLENIKTAILGYDWANESGEGGIWGGIRNAFSTMWDEVIDPLLPSWLSNMIGAIGTWIDANTTMMTETWNKLTDGIPWETIGERGAMGFWRGFTQWLLNAIPGSSTYSDMRKELEDSMTISGSANIGVGGGTRTAAATGLFVPGDGLYNLHAGETIVPAGTSGRNGGSGGGPTNIVVDFGNSVFNMASGIDIEDLADSVSRAIAEKTAWESY